MYMYMYILTISVCMYVVSVCMYVCAQSFKHTWTSYPPTWHVSGSADNGLPVLGCLPSCRIARVCLAPLSGFPAYCTRRLHGKTVQSCSECAAFPAQQDAATMVERMAPVAPYCKSHGGIGHRALAGHLNCRAGGNHRFGCFHRLFNEDGWVGLQRRHLPKISLEAFDRSD